MRKFSPARDLQTNVSLRIRYHMAEVIWPHDERPDQAAIARIGHNCMYVRDRSTCAFSLSLCLFARVGEQSEDILLLHAIATRLHGVETLAFSPAATSPVQ